MIIGAYKYIIITIIIANLYRKLYTYTLYKPR